MKLPPVNKEHDCPIGDKEPPVLEEQPKEEPSEEEGITIDLDLGEEPEVKQEEDIFDKEEPVAPKKKKKREISQKQRDHLARVRKKALEVRQAKAKKRKAVMDKKKDKISSRKKQLRQKELDEHEEEKEKKIKKERIVHEEEQKIKREVRQRLPKENPAVDKDYIEYIVSRTYEKCKADRKAKKERLKKEAIIKHQAKQEVLTRTTSRPVSQKPQYQNDLFRQRGNNSVHSMFSNYH